MSTKNIKTRIVHKHDTEANWLKSTFVPMQGEIIIYDIEVDKDGNTLELPEGRTTPYTYERFKIGDGKNLVSSDDLPFYGDGTYATSEHNHDGVYIARGELNTTISDALNSLIEWNEYTLTLTIKTEETEN